MEAFIITGIIILTIIISLIYQHFYNKKKMMRYILNMFGEKRENIDEQLERLDMTRKLYTIEQTHYPENERIDDITWDDLNMNHVFATVNHTTSFAGEQYLYSMLHHIPASSDTLRHREEMIQYFDSNEKKRIEIQKTLYRLGKSDSNYYIPEIIELLELQKIPFSQFNIFLLISLVVFAILASVTGNELALGLLLANFVVNLAIHSLLKMKYEINMSAIFSIARSINAAKSIHAAVPQFDPCMNERLLHFKKVMKRVSYIEQFKLFISASDVNSIIGEYLFGALLFDFILYDQILKDLLGKQEEYMQLYRYIGEIDCAISIASYRKSLETCCVPDSIPDAQMQFDSVCHPLIPNAVTNDFTLRKNVIITGSNASGKSTFIKEVAINLILGQSIHTCTARQAVIPHTCVLTSMAVRDDVVTGESYYIREIKYLKRMIERSSEGQLLFLAIDEILRGTNTKERIAASKAVLDYFKDKNCILMVATHDLELANYLENIYDNYHFCETVQDGDIVFDYILHNGISQSSNAIRLLEAIGFPETIVKNAYSEINA